MRTTVTDWDLLTERFRGSYSSEDPDPSGSRPVKAAMSAPGRRSWSVVVLSVLGSAVTTAAVGCVCALVYPILKELRAERFRGDDQIEQRMLGFWSILVLSLLAGSTCCVFSWTLTYLNSYQPGVASGPPLTLAPFRDESGRGFLMTYGVAVLNGLLAALAVVWSLT